ncbi:MAG: EAL domain-containing protein [Campylobacterales bacterium]|nr:EAL domain-containing protein [Campylobacterales bacterium]
MADVENHPNFTFSELKLFLEFSPSVYFKWDNDPLHSVLLVSPSVTKTLGYDPHMFESQALHYKDLVHPEDLNRVAQELLQHKEVDVFTHQPYRLRKSDGNYVWVEDTTQVLRDEKGMAFCFLGIVSDISSHVFNTKGLIKVTAFLENYKKALNESSIVTKSDTKGVITYVNKNFLEITGHTIEDLIGKPHSINRHPDTPKEVFRQMWETLKAKKVWKGILKNRKKDGSPYWVDMTILPMVDDQGELVEYIGVRHDISPIMKQRETILRQAFTHPLTQLPNREKLLKDIAETPPCALALLDVDKFSQINNLYGYNNGDTILTTLAQKIQAYLAPFERFTLYHLSADEFAITADKECRVGFEAVARGLLESIDHTQVQVESMYVMLDISCGISFEPSAQLLQTANIAMKEAKTQREDIVIYSLDLSRQEEYESNIAWGARLYSALKDNRVVPYYQPIINNKTLHWEKFEALVRLKEGEDKVYSPFYFLDIAKQTKQYKALTRAVVEKAFETFSVRLEDFSINLSIDDILDVNTRNFLFDSIKRYRLGERLVLEIVESEGIENFEEVTAFIDGAKELGCRIAIDDFGTGYSNFAYLLRLKADYIKIDGSMIENLATDRNSRLIVQAIVIFAKSIGLKTIAEFVKDEATFNEVVKLGIDYSQGYYFSPPLQEPPKIT